MDQSHLGGYFGEWIRSVVLIGGEGVGGRRGGGELLNLRSDGKFVVCSV